MDALRQNVSTLRHAAPLVCLMLVALCASPSPALAQAINEGFDDVGQLAGRGWVIRNNSSPLGMMSWFQGDPSAFAAHAGTANSYVAANLNNTAGPGPGTISSWLILPNRTLRDGDVLSFYTRKTDFGADYPDRLEVRLSANGASTDVGQSASSTGDFTSLLLSINPTLASGGYPTVWTRFDVFVEGLGAPTSGRLAFRYFVTNAGPAGANSDYIGIDSLTYTPTTCPQLTVTGNPTAGTWGQAYATQFSLSEGVAPIVFSLSQGTLPTGLTLDGAGSLAGTPTQAGTFPITVRAIDARGCRATRAFSLSIGTAPQSLVFPAQVPSARIFESGSTFAISPLASSAPPNSGQPIVYSSGSSLVCSVTGTTVTMLAEGHCAIRADQAGDANFSAAPTAVSFVTLESPIRADLRVAKSTSTPTALIGQTVSFSMTFANDGPRDATNVRLTDVPPSRLEPGSVVWACVEAVGISCPTPDVGSGEINQIVPNMPSGARLRFLMFGRVLAAANPQDDFSAFENVAVIALPDESPLVDPPENSLSGASIQVIPTNLFSSGFEPQPPP